MKNTNFHFEKNNVFTFKIRNAIGKIKGLLLFTNSSKTTSHHYFCQVCLFEFNNAGGNIPMVCLKIDNQMFRCKLSFEGKFIIFQHKISLYFVLP